MPHSGKAPNLQVFQLSNCSSCGTICALLELLINSKKKRDSISQTRASYHHPHENIVSTVVRKNFKIFKLKQTYTHVTVCLEIEWSFLSYQNPSRFSCSEVYFCLTPFQIFKPHQNLHIKSNSGKFQGFSCVNRIVVSILSKLISSTCESRAQYKQEVWTEMHRASNEFQNKMANCKLLSLILFQHRIKQESK